MKSSVLSVLFAILLASAAVMETGCGHDTVDSGSQDLNMTYTPNPWGSGRFDVAEFGVNPIQALPADPAEAAVFGTERLLFRFTPFTANLTLTQDAPFSHIALSAGTYRVTRIEFTPPTLNDNHLAPPPYTDCIDGVAVIDAQSAPGIPPVFQFDNPPSLTFTIQPGQTKLALTVDVPDLIAGYEAAFTCQYVPCPGCPIDPRPTLTAFDAVIFRDALLANITLK